MRSLENASCNQIPAAWSGLCRMAPGSDPRSRNGFQLLLVYTQGLGEHGPPVALADRDSG